MNVYDDAKRAFENPLPSGGSLTRAVAVLVRGGSSEGEARSWAGDMARDYGLVVDQDEFNRIIARGLRLAAPPEPEESEPEESEPPPEPIDVRPSNLGGLVVPSVAGLSPDELLRIAANPEATKRRYDKLRKQQAAAAKATEELAAARSEFDARVERTQAELVAKSASLQKEKAELFVAKNKFEETAERARNIIAEQTRVANIGRFKQVGPTLI